MKKLLLLALSPLLLLNLAWAQLIDRNDAEFKNIIADIVELEIGNDPNMQLVDREFMEELMGFTMAQVFNDMAEQEGWDNVWATIKDDMRRNSILNPTETERMINTFFRPEHTELRNRFFLMGVKHGFEQQVNATGQSLETYEDLLHYVIGQIMDLPSAEVARQLSLIDTDPDTWENLDWSFFTNEYNYFETEEPFEGTFPVTTTPTPAPTVVPAPVVTRTPTTTRSNRRELMRQRLLARRAQNRTRTSVPTPTVTQPAVSTPVRTTARVNRRDLIRQRLAARRAQRTNATQTRTIPTTTSPYRNWRPYGSR